MTAAFSRDMHTADCTDWIRYPGHHLDSIKCCCWLIFWCCGPSTAGYGVLSEMLFCTPQLYIVVIWVTIAFQSAWISLVIPSCIKVFPYTELPLILSKLLRLLGMKIPGDQQLQKHSNQSVWLQQPCHGQNLCDNAAPPPHSDGWWEHYLKLLAQICMILCIALLLDDWLIR